MNKDKILLIIAGIIIIIESIMIILLSMAFASIYDESVLNCELSNIHAETSNILIELIEEKGLVEKEELKRFELSICETAISPSLRNKLKEIKNE